MTDVALPEVELSEPTRAFLERTPKGQVLLRSAVDRAQRGC